MLLNWEILPGKTEQNLPDRIVTFAPSVIHPEMPIEVSLLLPTVAGNRDLLKQLAVAPPSGSQVAAGLFLADFFVNMPKVWKTLHTVGVNWICNLPTLGQYELSFRHTLSDVDFTMAKEIRYLAKSQREGFKTLLILTGCDDLPLPADFKPDAVAILPGVSAFVNGFPSLHHRQDLEHTVQSKLAQHAQISTLLSYREHGEELNSPAISRPRLIERIPNSTD